MRAFFVRLGVLPFAFLGVLLLFLGMLALNQIVNNFWPFDVARLDLVRATALDRASAAALLEAANNEVIISFLASIMVAVTGIVLPLVHYLNHRFSNEHVGAFLVLRQALWVGAWVAICAWLQMNRTLGAASAVLAALVLVIGEIMLQVRARRSNL